MLNQTSAWVAAAGPATDHRTRSAAFALSAPEFARERSYDRTLLRFTARGERRFTDGGFELANVHVLLLDAAGAAIARRGHESNRQTLLGPLTTWAHEVYDEQLAAAAALVYEVETRVDVRRVVLAAGLAPIELDGDERRPWPMTITAQPDDPLLRLAVRVTVSRGDIELVLTGEATDLHDGHRNDFELELHDEAGAVIATRSMSLGIPATNLAVTDYSLRLEKRVARAVRALVLRCRSEVRAITRVGPFTIPA